MIESLNLFLYSLIIIPLLGVILIKKDKQSKLDKIQYIISSIFFLVLLPLSVVLSRNIIPLTLIFSVIPCYLFLVSKHYRLFQKNKTCEWLIIFLMYSGITILWGQDKTYSFILWLQITAIIILGHILIYQTKLDSKNNEKRSAIINKLILGACISLVIICTDIQTNGYISLLLRLNYDNFIYSPAILNRGISIVSLIFWPITIYFIIKKKYLYSIIFVTSFILSVSISQNLSAGVATVIASFSFLLSQILGNSFKNIFKASILTGLILIPLLAVPITKEEINDKYSKILPTSATHRLKLWKLTMNRALEEPVLGNGLGYAAKFKLNDSDLEILNGKPMLKHSHNNMLQIFLELGLFGSVIFLMLVNATINKIYKDHDDKLIRSGYIAAFSSYIAIGLTGHGIWEEWWLISGIITILALALLLQDNKESSLAN